MSRPLGWTRPVSGSDGRLCRLSPSVHHPLSLQSLGWTAVHDAMASSCHPPINGPFVRRSSLSQPNGGTRRLLSRVGGRVDPCRDGRRDERTNGGAVRRTTQTNTNTGHRDEAEGGAGSAGCTTTAWPLRHTPPAHHCDCAPCRWMSSHRDPRGAGVARRRRCLPPCSKHHSDDQSVPSSLLLTLCALCRRAAPSRSLQIRFVLPFSLNRHPTTEATASSPRLLLEHCHHPPRAGRRRRNTEPCRSCRTSAPRRSNMRSVHCGHVRCRCASDDSIRCDSRRGARACGADRHPDDMCGAWPPWLLLWLFAVAVMTGGSCCCEGAAGRTEFCSDVGGVEAR